MSCDAAWLYSSPAYPNSICWSQDNLIAVAAGHTVSILNPADVQGPKAFVLHHVQPSTEALDVQCKPAHPQSVPPLVLAVAAGDGGSGKCVAVRGVTWSPPGAAADGGCLLATLTDDHKVGCVLPVGAGGGGQRAMQPMLEGGGGLCGSHPLPPTSSLARPAQHPSSTAPALTHAQVRLFAAPLDSAEPQWRLVADLSSRLRQHLLATDWQVGGAGAACMPRGVGQGTRSRHQGSEVPMPPGRGCVHQVVASLMTLLAITSSSSKVHGVHGQALIVALSVRCTRLARNAGPPLCLFQEANPAAAGGEQQQEGEEEGPLRLRGGGSTSAAGKRQRQARGAPPPVGEGSGQGGGAAPAPPARVTHKRQRRQASQAGAGEAAAEEEEAAATAGPAGEAAATAARQAAAPRGGARQRKQQQQQGGGEGKAAEEQPAVAPAPPVAAARGAQAAGQPAGTPRGRGRQRVQPSPQQPPVPQQQEGEEQGELDLLAQAAAAAAAPAAAQKQASTPRARGRQRRQPQELSAGQQQQKQPRGQQQRQQQQPRGQQAGGASTSQPPAGRAGEAGAPAVTAATAAGHAATAAGPAATAAGPAAFSVGCGVEVMNADEGLQGCWFGGRYGAAGLLLWRQGRTCMGGHACVLVWAAR